MHNHKNTLGILFIVSAVLQTMMMIASGLFLGFLFAMINGEDNFHNEIPEFVVTLITWLPGLVILFISLPTLTAGIGLLSGKSWAPTLALIMGCLKLVFFPFGTALGIYSIWVYFEDKKLQESGSVNQPPYSNPQ